MYHCSCSDIDIGKKKISYAANILTYNLLKTCRVIHTASVCRPSQAVCEDMVKRNASVDVMTRTAEDLIQQASTEDESAQGDPRPDTDSLSQTPNCITI